MAYQNDRVANVVDKINRQYFLPSMQREYVWKPEQIIALFDSLMKGYPISSFLFWRPSTEELQKQQVYRFIENYRYTQVDNDLAGVNGLENVELVLDGQQRLTSLLVGLRGGIELRPKHARKNRNESWTRHKLYINLAKSPFTLESDDNQQDDEIGLSVTYGLRFFPDNKEPENDASHLWMWIGEILECRNSTLKSALLAKLRLNRPNIEEKAWETASETFNQLYNAIWGQDNISYYVVQDEKFERVLDIFVRANSGGTKLGKSDLLLSTMVTHWHPGNARQEVHNFVADLNRQFGHAKFFKKDFVMKSCLLLSDLDPQYKVGNFTPSNIHSVKRNWQSIKDALLKTAKLLKIFGLDNANLTSANSVMPLAYYVMKNGRSDFLGSATFDVANRARMRRWLFGALLNRTFSGTSDSTLMSARRTISSALRDSEDFPDFELNRALQTSGRVTNLDENRVGELLEEIEYKDEQCFLLLSLLYERSDYSGLSIDHIMPQSRLEKSVLRTIGLTEQEIACAKECEHRIGNLQLITATDNSSRQNREPSEWMLERQEGFLDEHLIPRESLALLRDPRTFPQFVLAREKLIKRKLCQLFVERKMQIPG